MTIEQLKEIVPEEKRGEFDALVDEVRKTAVSDLVAGLDETNADAFIEKTPPLKSSRDRSVNKGIDTWQTNNVPKLQESYYNERYAKENPDETPEAKAKRELEAERQSFREEIANEKRKGYALRELTARGMDLDLVDRVFRKTDEETLAEIEYFATLTKTLAEQSAEAERVKILGENARTPDNGNNGNTRKLYTEAQLAALSPEEQQSDLAMESIRALEKQEQMR